jgi:predicted DsbA family dithiol-disulfide isomerase
MASSAVTFAIASPNINATIIEAEEYQDLSQRYEVRGVPRTIINEKEAIEGAIPVGIFLDKVLDAANAGDTKSS